MKKLIISLLLCSLPMVAIAQQEIQEAEKKAELVEKLNAPSKGVLGLGAVASVVSGLFYGDKYKQAKVDAEKIEKELYPWLKGLYDRSLPGCRFYAKGELPLLVKPTDGGPSEAEQYYPKLLKLGFFDRDLYVNVDSHFPYLQHDSYWDHVNVSPQEKQQGIQNDNDRGFYFNNIADERYPIFLRNARSIQYYDFLDRYMSDKEDNKNFDKVDPQAIYNDIVRPQVIKVGASAAAFAACIAGIVAVHTYYKKVQEKVYELKFLAAQKKRAS